MDLSIKFYSNNVVFNSKLSTSTIEKMDRIIKPMLESGIHDLDLMSKETGLSSYTVKNWFKESLGMSARKYFKMKKEEKIKQKLKEFYDKDAPMREAAEFFGRSQAWVHSQCLKFGFKIQKVIFEKDVERDLWKLLKAGFPIQEICKRTNLSRNDVLKWLNINIKGGLVKYRHDNNIVLKHSSYKKEYEQVEFIKKCFDEGKSIKETAKLLDVTSQKILILKEKYGIKSNLDKARERFEELAPKLIAEKKTLDFIVKEVGVSLETVRRMIIEKYGKSYREIKKSI